MKIGDIIWVFDENRRVYNKAGIGGPIWRKHWQEFEVVGETSRSWVVGPNWATSKVPKNRKYHGSHPWFAFSEEELDEICWYHQNRYEIIRFIERSLDYKKLIEVAKFVGYKEKRDTY